MPVGCFQFVEILVENTLSMQSYYGEGDGTNGATLAIFPTTENSRLTIPDKSGRATRKRVGRSLTGHGGVQERSVGKGNERSCFKELEHPTVETVLKSIGQFLESPFTTLTKGVELRVAYKKPENCSVVKPHETIEEVATAFDLIFSNVATFVTEGQYAYVVQGVLGPTLELAANAVDGKPIYIQAPAQIVLNLASTATSHIKDLNVREPDSIETRHVNFEIKKPSYDMKSNSINLYQDQKPTRLRVRHSMSGEVEVGSHGHEYHLNPIHYDFLRGGNGTYQSLVNFSALIIEIGRN